MNERIKDMLREVQGMSIAWEIKKDELPIWTIQIEPQMWGDESIGYYVRAIKQMRSEVKDLFYALAQSVEAQFLEADEDV